MSNDASEKILRAQRNHILRWGLTTSFMNRAFTAAVPLLLVPLALGQLGAADYGAWMAAASVTAIAGFTDLGIGTGLMTKLGAIQEQDGTERARKLIASAYAMTAAITAGLLALLLVSLRVVDWASVLGVPLERRTPQLGAIVVLTLTGVVVNIIASLVVRVQYGLGEQGASNLWQGTGSLVTLGAAFAVSRATPAHEWFVAVVALVPAICAAINTVTFFGVGNRGRLLRPRLSLASADVAKSLLNLGSRFLLVSLFMSLAVSLDPWIVARTQSIDTVPTYAVPARIFTMLGTVAVLAVTPLWPLHAQALAAGDSRWVRRVTLRMTVGMTTAILATSIAVLLLRGPIVEYWLNGQIPVDGSLWVALATWWTIQTVAGPMFMVQNGASVVWPQLLAYALLAALILPIKLWVGKEIGLAAIAWTGCIGYVIIVWPMCYLGYQRALMSSGVPSKVNVGAGDVA